MSPRRQCVAVVSSGLLPPKVGVSSDGARDSVPEGKDRNEEGLSVPRPGYETGRVRVPVPARAGLSTVGPPTYGSHRSSGDSPDPPKDPHTQFKSFPSPSTPTSRRPGPTSTPRPSRVRDEDCPTPEGRNRGTELRRPHPAPAASIGSVSFSARIVRKRLCLGCVRGAPVLGLGVTCVYPGVTPDVSFVSRVNYPLL